MQNLDISTMLPYLYEQITFEMFMKFIILYFLVIWIAVVVWVIKDITNRTGNVFFQICSILIVLIGTPLGVFIYLLIRPGKTLFEKYYEEIEDNLDTFAAIIDEKTQDLDESSHCFSCDAPISQDFKFCTHCKTDLKCKCKDCKKSIYIGWKICPYCGDKNKKYKQMIKEKTKAK